MTAQPKSPAPARAAETSVLPQTLDLAELAGIRPGDQVRVAGLANKTLELFDRTFDLVNEREEDTPGAAPAPQPQVRFLPQHDDLRSRFRLAQILGSYSALNAMLDRYFPAFEITQTITRTRRVQDLSSAEIRTLEDYSAEIQSALEHASTQLGLTDVSEFSGEELAELNEILNEARERFHSIEAVLGMRLIHDVEHAVERLCQIRDKIASVRRSLTGIFLVDSEIMFVPTAELIDIVDDIFKAIGNPYVVKHIDGTLLLAARNLLIQVVSFYAYYGREQIYQLFGPGRGASGRTRIVGFIRNEIKLLFRACKSNNKLVLTRVMDNAEREFEISVESIEQEATHQAITDVRRLMPAKPVAVKPVRKNLLSRLREWMFRKPPDPAGN